MFSYFLLLAARHPKGLFLNVFALQKVCSAYVFAAIEVQVEVRWRAPAKTERAVVV